MTLAHGCSISFVVRVKQTLGVECVDLCASAGCGVILPMRRARQHSYYSIISENMLFLSFYPFLHTIQRMKLTSRFLYNIMLLIWLKLENF